MRKPESSLLALWLSGSVFLTGGTVWAQTIEAVAVVSRPLERTVLLPGEFVPYMSVSIHAKVAGFVEKVEVDRGSVVTEGQVLATMVAPELNAQHAEAEAKVRTAEAQRVEVEARVVAADSTYQKLKAASATPGVVAGNDLVQAEKLLDAERAKVRAADSSIQAAQAAVKAIEDVQAYLRVTAPFAGVITTRNVHPGALVGTGVNAEPMFQLETINRLRLVVPVPEAEVGAIPMGARVAFTVPAYPTDTFNGTVSRVARSMDPKTRSMPVELDVANPNGRLAAGMYPSVKWPVHGSQKVLLVPLTSIVNTSERSFVIRVQDGLVEWVDVKRGPSHGDFAEVVGALAENELVLRRGSDEIRQGTRINARVASPGK
jgi:RND family efflux transporter MFP subunit